MSSKELLLNTHVVSRPLALANSEDYLTPHTTAYLFTPEAKGENPATTEFNLVSAQTAGS